MRQRIGVIALVLLCITVTAHASVTVYLRDGTRLEVDKVVRMGNQAALFLDISRIDTSRTLLEEPTIGEVMQMERRRLEQGLAITDVQFSPSDDNTEILCTGTVKNASQYPVKDIQISVTFMNKQEQILLVIHGFSYPTTLEAGQSGIYSFRAKRPDGFWKASVDVKAEARQ
jgi:hypothetical protein